MLLIGEEIKEYQELENSRNREMNELREKVEYWKSEAVKSAAELGEIKIKAAQDAAGGTRGVLNSLPDDLIGKRVWICYCNIILPGNIQGYEVGSEGTKVMVGTDVIGCVECGPDDIYSSAYEAVDAIEAKTTI